MTSPPARPPAAHARIPFWRDVRVLGVLAQIALTLALAAGVAWLGRNVISGLNRLGEAQFLCEDGTSNFRCFFSFMSLPASFDIGELPIPYATTDSYWRALQVGLLNTIKVAVSGIVLATLLGVITGIVVLSNNWLLRSLAAGYIDIIRNTPLLVQLFFIYFAVILTLPPVRQSLSPGLSIFLSQRGIYLPWPVFTSAALPWLAFLLLAVVQFQVLWVILGQREQATGRPVNRLLWAGLSAVAVVVLGWLFAVNFSSNQAVLVSRGSRVGQARTPMEGLQALVLRRLPISKLTPAEIAKVDPDVFNEAALTVCVVRGSAAEANFTAHLRAANIPYRLDRSDRPDQATADYAGGDCEVFAGPRVVLAAERATLESPDNHLLVAITEYPVVFSTPRLEGLNMAGGARLTPEFAAILFGLVLYTAAFIAEIVRAGILAVHRGQSEAARALGLSEGQRLRLVVLPQALRVIIPPLTSQYLNLTKNSSLAIFVGFPDLVAVTNTIMNQSGRPVQVIILVMLVYLSVSLSISALLNWYNRRVALVER